jgi:hypothetical protein
VDHGQLVNIPLIGRLVDLFRAARIAGLGLVQQEDRVSMRFQLRPDHLAISEFDLTSMVVAARGEGRIYYDQRLDLLINAGPLERMQSLFGRIGELVGQVTDVLVTYHVTGILSDPHFTPRPLGMGSRR